MNGRVGGKTLKRKYGKRPTNNFGGVYCVGKNWFPDALSVNTTKRNGSNSNENNTGAKF